MESAVDRRVLELPEVVGVHQDLRELVQERVGRQPVRAPRHHDDRAVPLT